MTHTRLARAARLFELTNLGGLSRKAQLRTLEQLVKQRKVEADRLAEQRDEVLAERNQALALLAAIRNDGSIETPEEE